MASRQTQVIVMRDFKGGLWLNEGNPPAETFAPFLENLNIMPSGGLRKRAPLRKDITYAPGVSPRNLPLMQNGKSPILIHPSDTTKFFVCMSPGTGNGLIAGTWNFDGFTKGNSVPTFTSGVPLGAAPTAFSMTWGSSAAGDRVYVLWGNAGNAQFTTAGAGLGLGVNANDNLAAPTDGNFPAGKVAAVHLAYMFVGAAAVLGTTTCKPNQLAWSHPNRFQDWRSFDNLPVGDASENIIGLHSYRQQLVIVKENSIWILSGYSPDTFQLSQLVDFKALSATASAINICSVSNTNTGVFVSKPGDGVYRWFNNQLTQLSTPLSDAINDSRIVITNMALIDNKLFCSSSGQSVAGGYTDKSWIYDTDLNCWTQHTAAFHGMIETGDTTSFGYSIHRTGDNLGFTTAAYEQQQAAGSWLDNQFTSTSAVVSTYRSPWLDAGVPATKKRWRRLYVQFNKRPNASASDPVPYNLTVYKDFDGVHASKTATTQLSKSVDTTEYNANYGYGHASTGSDYDDLHKTSSMGSSRAAQLKIDTSGTPADAWGIDSITVPYIVKRLH